MKSILAVGVALLIGWSALGARADRLELNDGTEIQGIIRKVEQGQVFIETEGRTQTFDILSVSKMDFDTPHLLQGTARLPAAHFTAPMEAQEMVEHFAAVERAGAEIRALIDTTKTEWADRRTIEPSEVPQWEAAKERFRAPLSRYQEELNDLYFHVLGKVDEYNRLTKEANQIYVGVKGIFQVGSPLIPKEFANLPLKKYVPGNWYDTIFFEGYDRGYNDAYEKYSQNPYARYESPER